MTSARASAAGNFSFSYLASALLAGVDQIYAGRGGSERGLPNGSESSRSSFVNMKVGYASRRRPLGPWLRQQDDRADDQPPSDLGCCIPRLRREVRHRQDELGGAAHGVVTHAASVGVAPPFEAAGPTYAKGPAQKSQASKGPRWRLRRKHS